MSTERAQLGDQIGSYNRKFAEKYERVFKKAFQTITSKKQVAQIMQQVSQKMAETMGTLGQGYEKLSTFSEWLDALDNNDFYN